MSEASKREERRVNEADDEIARLEHELAEANETVRDLFIQERAAIDACKELEADRDELKQQLADLRREVGAVAGEMAMDRSVRVMKWADRLAQALAGDAEEKPAREAGEGG